MNIKKIKRNVRNILLINLISLINLTYSGSPVAATIPQTIAISNPDNNTNPRQIRNTQIHVGHLRNNIFEHCVKIVLVIELETQLNCKFSCTHTQNCHFCKFNPIKAGAGGSDSMQNNRNNLNRCIALENRYVHELCTARASIRKLVKLSLCGSWFILTNLLDLLSGVDKNIYYLGNLKVTNSHSIIIFEKLFDNLITFCCFLVCQNLNQINVNHDRINLDY